MSLKVLKNTGSERRHGCNVSSVVCFSDGVASGSDDGKIKTPVVAESKLHPSGMEKILSVGKVVGAIQLLKNGKATKVWKPDLEFVSEMVAPGGILSMATCDQTLYTCSADNSIQAWDLKTMKNTGKLLTTLFQPQKLFVDLNTKLLWAGDSQGNVAKFEEGRESGKFELVEEVWDLMSSRNVVYTARDRDVVIAEIITGNERTRVMIKSTMEGRSPFCIVGTNFCFLDREGRTINVHENNIEKKFPKLKEITASDLIINALAGVSDVVYSGGYDSTVKKWDLKSSSCLGSVNLGCCVNSITCRSENEAYVARSDGYVTKVGC